MTDVPPSSAATPDATVGAADDTGTDGARRVDSSWRRPIEPGLLPLFRLVTALQILFLLALAGLVAQRPEAAVRGRSGVGIAILILFLAYLYWPWLRHRLGPAYLPLALAFASFAPVVGYARLLRLRIDAGVPVESLLRDGWLLIVLLLIPLILLAWQYGFAAVVGFCLLTTVVDLTLNLPSAVRGGLPIRNLVAVALVRILFFVPVGYVVARLVAAQRAQRESLREANARLARHASTLEQLAVSRERNRLARELHDTLAHSMSGVAVQLEAMSALWDPEPARARRMLGEALTSTRSGLREARRAIEALRATPLEDLGLPLAVRELAESAAAREGLGLELRIPDDIAQLQPATEQVVYRVAEEALANAVQHADARGLQVRLEAVDDHIRLVVGDDGRGFDPAGSGEGHYGLTGMRERAELIGARLEIESAPGAGTTVRLTVPVDE